MEKDKRKLKFGEGQIIEIKVFPILPLPRHKFPIVSKCDISNDGNCPFCKAGFPTKIIGKDG